MRLVEVFKGSQRDEMYLYVDHKAGTDPVPEELLGTLGILKSVMVIPMTGERKLARVSASDVLAGIEKEGYFLQMPPPPHASAEAQIAAMVKAEEELQDRE
jgi:uncharacterized protein